MALSFHLSGGAGNVTPDDSLGGVKASASMGGTSVTPTVAVGGRVEILSAAGLPAGGLEIILRAYTATFAYWEIFLVDSNGVMSSAAGNLSNGNTVTLSFGTLGQAKVTLKLLTNPSGTVTYTDTVTVTTTANNLFTEVSAAQVEAGTPIYRCMYLQTNAALANARLYVAQAMTGGDTMEVALDASGINGTALTLLDEEDSTDVLAGLTFALASTYETAIALPVSITSGQYLALWLKYTPDNTAASQYTVQEALIRIAYTI